jgi:hypothetical protein
MSEVVSKLQNITIVSDGTTAGSAVYTSDGNRINGITKVEIIIDANNNDVGAVIYINAPCLHIDSIEANTATSISEFTRQSE